jgi:cytochrome oxidase assembly protein ShyY1
LPERFDRRADEFRRVAVTGRFTGQPGAHGFTDAAYLTTIRPHGPGYRVIQPFETEGGRLLLVAETATGEGRFPLPLTPGVNLPNDHLEYAVTWGGMALVWSVMGGVLVRREWRRAA